MVQEVVKFQFFTKMSGVTLVVDCLIDPWSSGHTKDYEIGICSKHTASWSKSTDSESGCLHAATCRIVDLFQ